jgi:hypothetical protein
MKSLLTALFMCLFLSASMIAQTRYIDPVFDKVKVTDGAVYGVNATLLYFAQVQQAVPEALKMDVYEPEGDTETERPLILYLHTGNFLPFVNPATGEPGLNGSCGGDRKDSAAVEFCTRLAKMGYVVASCDYRLGWDPQNSEQLIRRYTIINAAYRGLQDVRTAIRFFRKDAALSNNTYNVDTTRITVWGQGTGGYVSYAAATLDNYLKIPTASSDPGKFLWQPPGAPGIIPMVIESVNGNIFGTSVGTTTTNPGTPLDTLCYPNHVGYSSDFNLMVNMGGALADSSWVDPGTMPIISYQVPTDPFAPYTEGILKVPGTNELIVEVQGAYVVQNMQNNFNNNDAFSTTGLTLDLTAEQQSAFARSPAGLQNVSAGLYPFVRSSAFDSAPWEWSAVVPNNPTCNTGAAGKAKALAHIDTTLRFFAPRACYALGIQPCIDAIVSAKEPLAPASIQATLAPNPATDQVRISVSSDKIIRDIQVIDAMGRIVRDLPGINNSNYNLQRNGLAKGNYVVKLRLDEGVIAKVLRME